MYDTADFSYILPTHRLTVYIMGILLGYCLRYVGRNYQLKNVSASQQFRIIIYMSAECWQKKKKKILRLSIFRARVTSGYSDP